MLLVSTIIPVFQEDILDSSSQLDSSLSPLAGGGLSTPTPQVVQRENLADLRRAGPPLLPIAASAPHRSWRNSVSIVETPRAPGGWQEASTPRLKGGQRPGINSTSSSDGGSVFSTVKKPPSALGGRKTAVAAEFTTPIRAPLLNLAAGMNNNNSNNNNRGEGKKQQVGGSSSSSYSHLLQVRAERTKKKYKYHEWIKSYCLLDLNLQEVAHIR